MAKKNSNKTECPITRQQFRTHAKPLLITVDGQTMAVAPRPEGFSTGSEGWFENGKITVMIDGVPIKVQANLTFTVVNSKELPTEATAA